MIEHRASAHCVAAGCHQEFDFIARDDKYPLKVDCILKSCEENAHCVDCHWQVDPEFESVDTDIQQAAYDHVLATGHEVMMHTQTIIKLRRLVEQQ